MDEHAYRAPFDEIGQRYDEAFTQRSAQIAAGAWLAERCAPRARVLDLGCGAGWPTAQQLAEAGLDVIGVDESERMLETARERVPSGQFLRGDMRALPADIGRFDAVTAFFSLMMLPRGDIPAVLAAARDLVYPGAPLALGMVEIDADSVAVDFLGTPIRCSGYPFEQLTEVVAGAGFTVESKRTEDAEVVPGRVERQIYLLGSAR